MKTVLSFIIMTVLFLFSACSESTNEPATQANVKIRSVMSDNIIQTIKLDDKYNNPQKSEVDSVRIKKIRILVKEIKFHSTGETDDNKDQLFKSGPFLYVGDETGANFDVAVGQMPIGEYDKVKFEIHRFSSSDISKYSNDITFSEFATSDRYSIIVEGIAYKYGVPFEFKYYGTPTSNISLKFEPSIKISQNVANDIYLLVNPVNMLKIGNSVLDPRDDDNSNDIDYLIMTAIKAIKK